ncbi:SDR family NAD(P)-dependent oxidoreductase [Streptomyces sp. ME03-5709C]|nr:SDR family NAD(P)-dependent oxidoreductase [Streptomyces sp. ME03-5709C]
MTTMVIVGAERGLGAAVARHFGSDGFDIALVARDQDRLDTLAAALDHDGVNAQGFAADVRDPAALGAALDAAAAALGPIEVLHYGPAPHADFMPPLLETTPADLAGPLEVSLYGAVTAVHAVLPDMRFLGHGTILFVSGGSAVRPLPARAGTSVAYAAQSAYARMLHDTLAAEDIHVAQLIVPGVVTPGRPGCDPAALAAALWATHRDRTRFRLRAGAPEYEA